MSTFNIFCLGTSHSVSDDEHLIVKLFNNTNAFDLNNVITGQSVIKQSDRDSIPASDISKEAQSIIEDLKKEFPDHQIEGEYSKGPLIIKENKVPVLELTQEDLQDRILFKTKPDLLTEILSAVKKAEEQNDHAPIKLIADGLSPKLHTDAERVAQSKTLPLQAMYGITPSDRAKGICDLITADGPPDQVNLIGHGRGAVMCIQIAYHLSEAGMGTDRSVPCSLFVVDPVKQRLDPDPEKNKSLFMNVDIDTFGCIFMEDVSEDMYPFINIRLGEYPDAYLTANRPNLFIRLPGDHSTVSHIAPFTEQDPKQYPLSIMPEGDKVAPPANWPIGLLALQIITLWQTKLGVSLVPSKLQTDSKSICETLFQINRANPFFFQTTPDLKDPDSLARFVNNGTDLNWIKENSRAKALDKAGLLNPYRFSLNGFINPHHILIFKKAWPALYSALFKNGNASTDTEELMIESQPYTKLFYKVMKKEKGKVDFSVPGWLVEK